MTGSEEAYEELAYRCPAHELDGSTGSTCHCSTLAQAGTQLREQVPTGICSRVVQLPGLMSDVLNLPERTVSTDAQALWARMYAFAPSA